MDNNEHLLKYKQKLKRYKSEFEYTLEHKDEFENSFDYFQKLSYLWRLTGDMLTAWKVDDSMAEKTHIELPLDQTKVDEHQKFLEKTQGVPADEDIIVGGN